MSDYLPFELQVEIIIRLPVQSLIQFRAVSKGWKSMIDSSGFVSRYSGQHTNPTHLFVSYYYSLGLTYISIADDDTFPKHKVWHSLPPWLRRYTVIGCSHGLLCLYDDENMAVLLNPSIRKTVDVVVPNVEFGIYGTVLGFGVCCETNDPKIIKIRSFSLSSYMERISSIPWQVEVYTLSTGSWRSPYNSNLPRISIKFAWLHINVNGFLYWLATDMITMDGESRSYNLIISFDITSEEFKEVNLPNNLAHQPDCNLSMSKLKESPVVLESVTEASNPVFVVWIMEDGVPTSFTKMFTIDVNTQDDASVLGFRKNGEPIIELLEEDDLRIYELVVYDPYSKHIEAINTFEHDRLECSSLMHPYMESLLLLDQPKSYIF